MATLLIVHQNSARFSLSPIQNIIKILRFTQYLAVQSTTTFKMGKWMKFAALAQLASVIAASPIPDAGTLIISIP